MTIKVSVDFSPTPGGRYRKEGDNSGEEFREELLSPKFEEAIAAGEKLSIDFDDTYGYPNSFIEEAFGGLARIHGIGCVLKNIEIISYDEPGMAERVTELIRKAVDGRGKGKDA